MINLLEKFENKQPEIVFEWKDPETEAIGRQGTLELEDFRANLELSF